MEEKNNKITIRLKDETMKKYTEGMKITGSTEINEFMEKSRGNFLIKV